jgi:hypothetical protein
MKHCLMLEKHMRSTLTIEDELLSEAKKTSGIDSTTAPPVRLNTWNQ